MSLAFFLDVLRFGASTSFQNLPYSFWIFYIALNLSCNLHFYKFCFQVCFDTFFRLFFNYAISILVYIIEINTMVYIETYYTKLFVKISYIINYLYFKSTLFLGKLLRFHSPKPIDHPYEAKMVLATFCQCVPSLLLEKAFRCNKKNHMIQI